MSKPSSSDIAKHAYHLWEREGRPHGQDQEYWYRAEREILGAATAEEDRPIGEIRSAQQASARQSGQPAPSKTPNTPAPNPLQAAAASPGRSSQAQGSQGEKTAQLQATQGGAAQQSASGKSGAPSAAKRKPRAGGKQPNP